jgi:sulfatase maturation enzyme AslB (radical SAM superfamily)
MAYGALTAFLEKDCIPPSGIVMTAILPGGCPLDCPFCILKQRDERRHESYLTPEHLSAVMQGLRNRGLLGGVAIVGDEPLQEHCWPTARMLLDGAVDCKLPAAVISNGYNLVDFVDELRQLDRTKVLISLDAASEEHDAIRRTPGAFARISEGIKRAVLHPELRERLAIASILMPGNLSALSEIITFTAANGIPQLFVSPLLSSSRTTPLAVHPKIMAEACEVIPQLLEEARVAGVRLRLSDEFTILGPWEEQVASAGIEIVAPKTPARLIRIDAAGRLETLTTMKDGSATGLQVPSTLADIDPFVDRVVEMCMEQSAAAA